MHGGTQPAGIAHYRYTTGQYVGESALNTAKKDHRYREYLPQTIQQAIEQASTDPDIHSLHEQIALADGMLNDLLRRRYECGDPGKGWKDLTFHWRQLQACQATGDIPGMHAAFAAIGPLIERMQSATTLDSDIREQQRLLADLTLREHKRLVDLQSHIPPEAFVQVLKRQQVELRRCILEHCEQGQAEALLYAIREAYIRIDIRAIVGAHPVVDITPIEA